MKVYTTAPLEDPRRARTLYPELEDTGYDGVFSFEAKHDPFLALAVAAEHTQQLRLGTGIAIAFARNPMNLANLGYDMQSISGGRFVLGLGSQVKPHIEKRFSAVWSHPAERMREIVQAIKAIWDCWEGRSALDFRGRFYTHTLMIPAFDPGPNPYGPPPILTGGFGPTGLWPSLWVGLVTPIASGVARPLVGSLMHDAVRGEFDAEHTMGEPPGGPTGFDAAITAALREVDEVLMDHPAVQQVVTFAVPHAKLGEEVAAAIVLREGMAADEREIREFAARRLADFKVPRTVVILAEIPKGATGKLQRIGLAQKLGLGA